MAKAVSRELASPPLGRGGVSRDDVEPLRGISAAVRAAVSRGGKRITLAPSLAAGDARGDGSGKQKAEQFHIASW